MWLLMNAIKQIKRVCLHHNSSAIRFAGILVILQEFIRGKTQSIKQNKMSLNPVLSATVALSQTKVILFLYYIDYCYKMCYLWPTTAE